MGRSALRMALAAEKGQDPRDRKLKRVLKEKHRAKVDKKNMGVQDVDEDENEDEDDEDESMEEESKSFDIDALNDSDSDSESEIEMEEKIIRPKNDPPSKKREEKAVADDEEEDEEEDEEDVPLSDLEGEEERDDMVPHTRLTINNKAALQAALARISIDTSSSAPFATHQSIVSSKPTAEAIPDVSDDLQRELALLSQSLEAARKGRSLLIKEGVPFSRPGDYFAEMAKDDGQMQKVKEKLVEEATAKKAAADARKLRDLKKFGKQVQIAKLQERQKAKKDTLEKINLLKKKRQEGSSSNLGTNEGDLFDVAVDNEIKGYGNSKTGAGRGRNEPNAKRQKKNDKYGFGGKKRHSKSGDAVSSGDVSGFNNRRGPGVSKGRVTKSQRPGKNRRKAMASK
ncbi:Ebp2p [Verticillium alfalfae VaMs.102]|uniref:Ebp2p n=1 Tax=Verticillium alfalfae (strain VaMs.102 / ATCC MYA-4576 / FGSC 10136) TaxID=526221 RepID=C9S8A9_VERA1|nr:Ebp2p [Verticillium alfalfae VaMs.102]EEY13919.1 Ebp2p [Verticillium alfalfae VaMs.102]